MDLALNNLRWLRCNKKKIKTILAKSKLIENNK